MRRYVVGVTVFAAVFTIPRYFEYQLVQSEELSNGEQNNSATSMMEDVVLTSWDVEQTNLSKNRIYRIVYFNLNQHERVAAKRGQQWGVQSCYN